MTEIEEFSRLSSFKECPICGQVLEKGYANAPGGVLWLKKKPKVLFTTIFDSRFVVPIPAFHTIYLPAVRCRNCNLVAFMVAREVGRQAVTPKSFFKKCVKCGEEIPVASEYCPKCGVEQKKKADEELRRKKPKVVRH